MNKGTIAAFCIWLGSILLIQGLGPWSDVRPVYSETVLEEPAVVVLDREWQSITADYHYLFNNPDIRMIFNDTVRADTFYLRGTEWISMWNYTRTTELTFPANNVTFIYLATHDLDTRPVTIEIHAINYLPIKAILIVLGLLLIVPGLYLRGMVQLHWRRGK